ncbi:MAG TPA: CBS domain-containing protein, partial [Candidatus Limnocylindrales bacterium]|nr:CBS domain-containing protein [Candidatus Limnocylindrales bacterium]
MTRTVVSIRPETPVREVARLLDEHRISGVPVVDDHGSLVGVVSEADFLRDVALGAEPRRRSALARLFGRGEDAAHAPAHGAATAADLMTSSVISVPPDEPVSEAAALMTRSRINRLPVVEDGRLVGIVTRADLVRAYVRSDHQLAETIREDVLRETLW